MVRREPRDLTPEEQDLENRHRKTTVKASVIATLGSTVALAAAIFPAVAFFGRPAIIGAIAEGMAPIVNAQVAQQLTPVNEGVKAIIRSRVAQLEDEIAELERRDRIEPLDAAETQRLTSKRRELRDQQNALRVITNTENTL